MDPDQRAELVEWLWRVALADARLDKYEEAMVRRVADLLGVPHHEFIRRKLLAREASGRFQAVVGPASRAGLPVATGAHG